jgi:hypothetical protein
MIRLAVGIVYKVYLMEETSAVRTMMSRSRQLADRLDRSRGGSAHVTSRTPETRRVLSDVWHSEPARASPLSSNASYIGSPHRGS